jgi:hypothetical protein
MKRIVNLLVCMVLTACILLGGCSESTPAPISKSAAASTPVADSPQPSYTAVENSAPSKDAVKEEDNYNYDTIDPVPEEVIVTCHGKGFQLEKDKHENNNEYAFRFQPRAGKADYANGAELWRYDFDGNIKKRLTVTDEPMQCMGWGFTTDAHDGWMYYSTDAALYKISTDGRTQIKIAPQCAQFVVMKDARLLVNYKTEDNRLHILDGNTDESFAVQGSPAFRLFDYDKSILYYGVYEMEEEFINWYMFDTATGKSELLFYLLPAACYRSGMVAEDGKLYFFDSDYTLGGENGKLVKAGKTPAIVCFDLKSRRKKTVVKLPEAKKRETGSLVSYSRYFLYALSNGYAGDMRGDIFAYDRKTGKKTLLAQILRSPLPDIQTDGRDLFINDMQFVQYGNIGGLKKIVDAGYFYMD